MLIIKGSSGKDLLKSLNIYYLGDFLLFSFQRTGFSFFPSSSCRCFMYLARRINFFASAASPIPHHQQRREKEEKRGREEREKRREKEEEEKRKANIMAVKMPTILIIASAIVLMSHNLVQ